MRQEFVERRIEETDRGREAFERLEDAGEILALVRQELRQRGFAVVDVVGQDHLAHGVDAVAFEEHVLGAGEADAGGAESEGVLGLLRIVGVGADLEARGFRAPVHELVEGLELLGLLRGLVAVEHARDDFARRGRELRRRKRSPAVPSIERKSPSLKDLAGDGDGLLVVIDLQALTRRRRRPCPSAARPAPRAKRRRLAR